VIFHILWKSTVAKGCKVSLHAPKFIGVSNRNRVPSNGSIFELDLTKAKYNISRLRWKNKMLFWELVPVISVHVITENRRDDENEVCSQYAHPILNTICSQYKGISKSVLIIQEFRLPGKRDDSNFTEIRLHKISRTPFTYTISIRLQKKAVTGWTNYSSGNSRQLEWLIASHKPVIKILKSKGPKTDSWGTTDCMTKGEEIIPSLFHT
jgi:hypothetical protein